MTEEQYSAIKHGISALEFRRDEMISRTPEGRYLAMSAIWDQDAKILRKLIGVPIGEVVSASK